MYHEDLIKRSFRECLGDICCYGTVKHNDLGSEMGAEKRDERKMFGCRHGMKGVGFGAETAAKKGVAEMRGFGAESAAKRDNDVLPAEPKSQQVCKDGNKD
nr:hypothetical protein [Tanacetum cinerariifolium]